METALSEVTLPRWYVAVR